MLFFFSLINLGLSLACYNELESFSMESTNYLWSNYSRVNNPAFNGENHSSQPAFVALPRSIEHVQEAIRCATKKSLPVSIKSGGHSFAGYSTTKAPGFMINMRNMTSVEWINNDTAVVVQAGCTWEDVYSAFKTKGGDWIVTGGLCPSVGISGFTLGGGVGPNARHFGMAIDNLLAVKMVTVEGELVEASETKNSDLLWALKGGGGGNMGILVELTFNVHHGSADYTFSKLCYDNLKTSEIQNLFQTIVNNNINLTTTINIDITYDNQEICLYVIYQGNMTTLSPMLSPYKLITPPTTITNSTFNCFHEMIEAYAVSKGYSEYSDEAFYDQNCFINYTSIELLPAYIPVINANLSDLCGISMIHFGGKIREVESHDTVFPWRETAYMLAVGCSYANSQEKIEIHAFLDSFFKKISPLCQGSYINFIDPYLKDWEYEYYGSNLKRLKEVKRKWNPNIYKNNPLTFNQEITNDNINDVIANNGKASEKR